MRRVVNVAALVSTVLVGLFPTDAQAQQSPYSIVVGPRQAGSSLQVTGTHPGGMTLEARPVGLRGRILEFPPGKFLDLSLPDGTTTEIGEPALPAQRVLVDVPFGATDVTVEVLGEQWVDYRLSSLGDADFVMPVQAPLAKIPGAKENAEFLLDREIYRTNSFLPEQVVTVEEAGLMRGHRLMSIAVHPLRYNPAKGALRLCTSLDLALRYRNADVEGTKRIHQRYRSPFFGKLLENHVANWSPDEGGGAERGPTADALPLPIGYLIITHPNFAAGIQSLADWKAHIGYDVTVATTTTTGSTATQIRSYIQNAYNTWSVPPQFVLLVGDSGYLPGFQGSTTGSIDDLDYSLMDSGNYFPDLFVGRFSVANTAQLQSVVDKVLHYEQLNWNGQSWIKKAAFLASVDNYNISEGTHNHVINNYLNPAGYASDKLYQVTYGANTQDVRNSLNDGRSLAVYSGHGSQTSWGDGPPFSQGDVNGLTNLDMYPIVCSHSCLTGDFEVPECFGETWQRAPGKAGVMFWGASTYSYWDEDDILEKGAFQAAFQDGLYFVSGLTNEGLLDVYTYYGGGGLSEYYYEEYNVLGDPSMFLRTEDLQGLAVTHDNSVAVGAAQLNVSVVMGGNVLEDALVHASKAGEVFVSAYTDASGNAVLPFNTTTPGNLDLVITAHNAIRYEAAVTVFVPSGPYLVLDDYLIDDSLGGNNDGDIDIGETIDLTVAAENVGLTTASGVTASLTTTSAGVTITDGAANIGDVAAGAVVWGADGFQFQLSSMYSDGEVVPFTITFSDSGTGVWDSALNLVVNAPALSVDACSLDDVGGNNNGKADPGEAITVEVILRNSGHHLAESVTVNLHTSDAFCNITQPVSGYPDIPAGGTETNATPFLAQLSSSCPLGRTVIVNLDVYRQGMLCAADQMSFVVGQIPLLIIDLDQTHNSAPAMESALTALGVDYQTTLSWPTDLSLYSSLMICLGIYSDNTSLDTTEANALVAYLQSGGNVYMEGGDCWEYDSNASIYCGAFGISGLADGSGDTGTILGQTGTIAEGLTLQYTGDNNWMDHLGALTGAVLIFQNQSPSYGNGVSFDAGAYKSIGVSFEFGGIGSGAGYHRLDWMVEILKFLEFTKPPGSGGPWGSRL